MVIGMVNNRGSIHDQLASAIACNHVATRVRTRGRFHVCGHGVLYMLASMRALKGSASRSIVASPCPDPFRTAAG